MYLLDTNVVSLLDPRRREIARDLPDWLRRNGGRLHLSVVTLTELERGVLKLRRDGQDRRAAEYERLREAVQVEFAGRILALDSPVALAIAHVSEAIRPRVIEAFDLIIAATARVHGLTVLTRNLRHFEPTGVPALDPLAGLPPDGR